MAWRTKTVFSIQSVSQFEENVPTSLGVMVKLERQFASNVASTIMTQLALLAAPQEKAVLTSVLENLRVEWALAQTEFHLFPEAVHGPVGRV